MRSHAVPLVVALAAVLSAPGCGEESPAPTAGPGPDGTPPAAAPADAADAPAVTPPTDRRQVEFLGLRAPKPVTWIWQPPRHELRLANYIVPGIGDGDAAHLVISHLGEDQGGTVDANIDRWAAAFRGPDGGPVAPDVERLTVAGMPVTVVELAGAWMKPGTGWHTADQRLLAAVLETPTGPVFIQLSGASDTVARNRDPFLELVRGIRAGDGAAAPPP
ncbi:MAG: hypothetical protein ACYTG1_12510 [Planctomycetota bacterium]|jgi:hypothetical protein